MRPLDGAGSMRLPLLEMPCSPTVARNGSSLPRESKRFSLGVARGHESMNQLDVYIAQLRKSLPRDLGARYRARILEELQEHLLETAAAAQETGLSEDDAWRQAIRRCGTPQEIAGGFLYIIETRRARRIQYALLPLLVMCFGLVS